MAIGNSGALKRSVTLPSGINNVRQHVPSGRKLSTAPLTPKLKHATKEVVKTVEKSLVCYGSDIDLIKTQVNSLKLSGCVGGTKEQLSTVSCRHARRAYVNSRETHKFDASKVSFVISVKDTLGRKPLSESDKLPNVVAFLKEPEFHSNINMTDEISAMKVIRAEIDEKNTLYPICSVLEKMCLGQEGKKELKDLLAVADLRNDKLIFHVLTVLTTLAHACDNAPAYADENDSPYYMLGQFGGETAQDLFASIMKGCIGFIKTSTIPVGSSASEILKESDRDTVLCYGAYEVMDVIRECLSDLGKPIHYQVKIER